MSRPPATPPRVQFGPRPGAARPGFIWPTRPDLACSSGRRAVTAGGAAAPSSRNARSIAAGSRNSDDAAERLHRPDLATELDAPDTLESSNPGGMGSPHPQRKAARTLRRQAELEVGLASPQAPRADGRRPMPRSARRPAPGRWPGRSRLGARRLRSAPGCALPLAWSLGLRPARRGNLPPNTTTQPEFEMPHARSHAGRGPARRRCARESGRGAP